MIQKQLRRAACQTQKRSLSIVEVEGRGGPFDHISSCQTAERQVIRVLREQFSDPPALF